MFYREIEDSDLIKVLNNAPHAQIENESLLSYLTTNGISIKDLDGISDGVRQRFDHLLTCHKYACMRNGKVGLVTALPLESFSLMVSFLQEDESDKI